MLGIFHSVGLVFELSLLLHSFSFCEEHQTGGQHPPSKIEIRWECWSANKLCLLISEVLGIEGIVLVHVYPVLSGRTIRAQPENYFQGVGTDPLYCSIPLVFREAEGEEILPAWPWQQRAGWWKGQLFLAKASGYQMLLLLRSKCESLIYWLDKVWGLWGFAMSTVQFIAEEITQKCKLWPLFALSSANKWESCIVDKRFHMRSRSLIRGAKLMMVSKGLLSPSAKLHILC